jgi:VanZ family protein
MIAVGRISRHFATRFAPAVAWMLAIFALSSRSHYPQPRELLAELLAVAVHLAAYATLSLLLLRGFAPTRMRGTAAALAVAIATAYGISDEVHQSFVAGRSATVFDVGVDFVGAVAGVWIGSRRWFARRTDSPA